MLVEAVRSGSLDVLASLIEAGADVNCKSAAGCTPLIVAAGLGRVSAIELLLVAGADVHILDSRAGASALHQAAIGGVVDAARLLLQAGAFIDLQSALLGHTPLMDAVWTRQPTMVAFLLEQNANPFVRNRYGVTALELAHSSAPHAGLSERVQRLTRSILDLLQVHQRHQESVAQAQKLIAAVGDADLEAVKRAIDQGCDLNERAVLRGSLEDGCTPLLAAARLGYVPIAKELLNSGANPHLVDYFMKSTVAHKAAYMGHADIARLFCSWGVELNAQGPYNGYTALHDAVWNGHGDIVDILVKAGVRLDLRGHNGKTALDLAVEYGYMEIAETLCLADAVVDK